MVVGLQVLRTLAGETPLLVPRQLERQRRDDLLRDLVLDREDVGQLAVVPLGPEMAARLAVDQLRGDADAGASLAHAAFQHVAHAELAADVLNVDGAPPVDEGGVAGDDEQARDLRQIGDNVLGDAVAEIGLLGITAHIVERQNDDRGLLGHRQRRVKARPGPRSEEHTSELQSLMRISYDVFCLKKKKKQIYK